MFNLTPEQLLKLAMEFDPGPVIAALSTGGIGGGPGNETGAFESSDRPYGNILDTPGPAQALSQQPPAPPAPLDPKSLGQLSSMMPKQQEPRFIGGAAPRQPVPVNLQIPDLASLIQLFQGQQKQSQQPIVPTLGSLLQGGR